MQSLIQTHNITGQNDSDLNEQKCIKLAAKMNSMIAMSFEINTLLT